MFRWYLKTCSVPLEHVIRENRCLQVFSDRVNSSSSFNKVTINPLCCLYPASWRPVNDNAPSEMIRKRWMLTHTYTLELLSVPVGQCDWGLSQSHFIPLVYGTIKIVVEKNWVDNQNLTALACQKNCAPLLSFELNLVSWPNNWFKYSPKHHCSHA